METIKSGLFLFLVGLILLIVSFVVSGYIVLTGIFFTAGIIGDVQWISHLLGIIFVILGYRRKQ